MIKGLDVIAESPDSTLWKKKRALVVEFIHEIKL